MLTVLFLLDYKVLEDGSRFPIVPPASVIIHIVGVQKSLMKDECLKSSQKYTEQLFLKCVFYLLKKLALP